MDGQALDPDELDTVLGDTRLRHQLGVPDLLRGDACDGTPPDPPDHPVSAAGWLILGLVLGALIGWLLCRSGGI